MTVTLVIYPQPHRIKVVAFEAGEGLGQQWVTEYTTREQTISALQAANIMNEIEASDALRCQFSDCFSFVRSNTEQADLSCAGFVPYRAFRPN